MNVVEENKQYFDEMKSEIISRYGLLESICIKCGHIFYAWQSNDNTCANCREMPSTIVRAPGYAMSTQGFQDRLISQFNHKGVRRLDALSLDKTSGETSFVVAAIQILEGALFRGQQAPEGDVLVLQPSYRTTAQELIATGGFMNTFINVASIKYNASFEDYLRHVDIWLEIFKSEFPLSDIKFEIRNKDQDWGNGKFSGIIIDVYIDNIPVGDLILWIGFPLKDGKVDFIDCGFGYERLLWAKQGGRFKDVLPSIDIVGDVELIDIVRSIVLIMMTGVNAYENKVRIRVQKLRSLISSLKERYPDLDNDVLRKLVLESFDHWAEFIEPMVPLTSNYIYWKLRGYLTEN